jgi:hypothetical protein
VFGYPTAKQVATLGSANLGILISL